MNRDRRKTYRRRLPLRLEQFERRDVPAGFHGPMPEQAAPPAFDSDGDALIGNRARISDPLLRMYQMQRQPGLSVDIGSDPVMTNVGPVVTITAFDVVHLQPRLEALGFQTIAARPERHFLEGSIPLSALPAAEKLRTEGLLGIVDVPRPQTQAGSVTWQGDWALEADRVRKLTGFDGKGQRIGILSDSFDRTENPSVLLVGGAIIDYATGDLPASGVKVLQELPSIQDGIDEGRAMAQIIHDIAPGAALSFATATISETSFANNIARLADPADGNCNIIVDDIVFFEEPVFQHGEIAQAVNNAVTGKGVAYFSAAGNYGSLSYDRTGLTNSNFSIDGFSGKNYLDFDTSVFFDRYMSVTIQPGSSVNLVVQWDQPFFTTSGVTTDLDIHVRDTTLSKTIVVESDTNNKANQRPVDRVRFKNNSKFAVNYDINIELAQGDAPSQLRLISYSSPNLFAFNEYGGNGPTIIPHAAIENAIGTAAINYYDRPTAANYTSHGNLTTIFGPFGTKLPMPVTEPGPIIAAIDAGNTTFFGTGSSADRDNDGRPNFRGTSAAAPTAAAIAALVWQANPSFTHVNVRDQLIFSATGGGSVTPNPITGFGLINAFDAIYKSALPPVTNFGESFESGALERYWHTNSTQSGRIEVTKKLGPDTGFYHVIMDSRFGDDAAKAKSDFSLNELTLTINAAEEKNLQLSFRARDFGDENDSMPVGKFTGSALADGVALSVDGTNWYSLFADFGGSLTNIYSAFTVNLGEFALANGLTLSGGTKIRFSQYDDVSARDNMTGDGIAIDSVTVSRKGVISGAVIEDGFGGVGGWRVHIDDGDGKFEFGNRKTFSMAGPPVSIPDGGKATSTIMVPSASGPIADLNVTLSISHTNVEDLVIDLVSPTGSKISLYANNGNDSLGLVGLTFDDDSIYRRTDSRANTFTGTYSPATPDPSNLLSKYNGASAVGGWKLEVTDVKAGKTGKIDSWSLDFAFSHSFTNSMPVPIPEGNFINPGQKVSPIMVSGVVDPINDVNVKVSFIHDAIEQCELDLISPTGVRVPLFFHSAAGKYLIDTTFDDQATKSFMGSMPPYTGSFRPHTPLSRLNGLSGTSVNGTWLLVGSDLVMGVAGAIGSWTLNLTTGENVTYSAAGSGDYSIGNLLGPATVVLETRRNVKFSDPTTGKHSVTLAYGDDATSRNFLHSSNSAFPTVTMKYLGPQPSGKSVDFDVTFSEPVTGVSKSNFSPREFGTLSGSSISSVAGSGANYTVTVSAGSGAGNLGLQFDDSFGVIDSANSPIPVVINSENNAAVGLTGPSLVSITRVGSQTTADAVVSWTVVFNEPTMAGKAGFETVNIDGVVTGVEEATCVDPSGFDTVWTVKAKPVLEGSFSLRIPAGVAFENKAGLDLLGGPHLGGAFIIDRLTPSAKIEIVGGTKTAGPVATWKVSFNEPVMGLSVANFALVGSGAMGASVLSVVSSGGTPSTTTYTVAATIGAAGSLGLNLANSMGLTDTANNAVPSATGPAYTVVDNSVVSITRTGGELTNATSVSWTVTFSDPFIGVNLGNFTLAGMGAAGASLTGIGGGGTTWTISAKTGVDGALGLNMVNSNGATSDGLVVRTIPFIGESYTVDRTAPEPVSITRDNPDPNAGPTVSWTVEFTEDVTGLGAANFLLTSYGANGASITSLTGSGTTWTLEASTGESGFLLPVLNSGTGVFDKAGNPLTGAGFLDEGYTILTTAPAVVSLNRVGSANTNDNSVSWTLTTSKILYGLTVDNFFLFGAGAQGADITSVSGSGTSWTITATTGDDGLLGLTLSDSENVGDGAFQAISNVPFDGQTFNVDRTSPVITSIVRSDPNPTLGPTVHWTVTFSESVGGVSASNFVLTGTGATGATIDSVMGGGSSWTVTATTGALGILRLDMTSAMGVSDGVGNGLVGVPFIGEAYTVVTVPAKVDAIVIGDGTAQRSRVTSIALTFSQIVSFMGAAEGAFSLVRQSDSATVTLVALVDDTGPSTVVTLTFSGTPTDFGSLADGRYTLTIDAAKVSNANGSLDGNGDGMGGDNYVLTGTPANGLFRLFGDADGNGSVGTADFQAFRLAFGSSSSIFDFDQMGGVGTFDFSQFRTRFGASV